MHANFRPLPLAPGCLGSCSAVSSSLCAATLPPHTSGRDLNPELPPKPAIKEQGATMPWSVTGSSRKSSPAVYRTTWLLHRPQEGAPKLWQPGTELCGPHTALSKGTARLRFELG